MSETFTTIQVVISKLACCRIQAINDLKLQAVNLGLNNDYINLLNNWLATVIPMGVLQDVIDYYDQTYESIVEARASAFNDFAVSLRNQITLPPVSSSP